MTARALRGRPQNVYTIRRQPDGRNHTGGAVGSSAPRFSFLCLFAAFVLRKLFEQVLLRIYCGQITGREELALTSCASSHLRNVALTSENNEARFFHRGASVPQSRRLRYAAVTISLRFGGRLGASVTGWVAEKWCHSKVTA